ERYPQVGTGRTKSNGMKDCAFTANNPSLRLTNQEHALKVRGGRKWSYRPSPASGCEMPNLAAQGVVIAHSPCFKVASSLVNEDRTKLCSGWADSRLSLSPCAAVIPRYYSIFSNGESSQV